MSFRRLKKLVATTADLLARAAIITCLLVGGPPAATAAITGLNTSG